MKLDKKQRFSKYAALNSFCTDRFTFSAQVGSAFGLTPAPKLLKLRKLCRIAHEHQKHQFKIKKKNL